MLLSISTLDPFVIRLLRRMFSVLFIRALLSFKLRELKPTLVFLRPIPGEFRSAYSIMLLVPFFSSLDWLGERGELPMRLALPPGLAGDMASAILSAL